MCSRPLALAALGILAIATAPLALIAGIAASSAVLIAVAFPNTVGKDKPAPTTSG
ncbi:MAG: hypothetical protein ACXVFM_10610 [Solirubrobacteraceae bacterium]